jgi:N6-L-threonylcarbamoyladenine synthase
MGMKILGIETSCDETAVAVVEDGWNVLSSVIASQVDIHSAYGGVVPEVASRQHVIHMTPTVAETLREAGMGLGDVDAIAVTHGPGLAGALLVGLNFAKALAFSRGIPLIGINHLEGHIYAAWLSSKPNAETGDPEVELGFPFLCLIASGGHTDLVLMEGHGQYRLLGRTRDDAAGEAFDKAARILGLGFPGGPEIQRVSEGVRSREPLPRAWLRGTLEFSFSGVKTALLHRAQEAGIYPPTEEPDQVGTHQAVGEMAAAFQESLVDVMVSKTLEAADTWHARGIILGGGVTANAMLRQEMVRRSDLPCLIPPPVLCTDNGAMIAGCAYHHISNGRSDSLDLDVDPSLSLG